MSVVAVCKYETGTARRVDMAIHSTHLSLVTAPVNGKEILS